MDIIKIISIYGIIFGIWNSLITVLNLIYQHFGLPKLLVKLIGSILSGVDIAAIIYLAIFIVWVIASIQLIKYKKWSKIILGIFYCLSIILLILFIYMNASIRGDGFSRGISTFEWIYIPLLILWHACIIYILFFKESTKELFNKSKN